MAWEVQRERTFRAEATLKELEKGKWPRMVSSEGFEILKGKPTATAEIMYKADDPEAALFASSIFGALTSFGWRVSRPTPIPATIQADQILSALQAGPLGVTMTIKSIPLDINHPYQQLARALSKSTAAGPVQLSRDPSLPDNLIKIIIILNQYTSQISENVI